MTRLVPEDWPQPYSVRTSVLTGQTELMYDGKSIGRFSDEGWADYIKNVLNGHEVGWPEPKEEGKELDNGRDQH